jgi:hypothetical protein
MVDFARLGIHASSLACAGLQDSRPAQIIALIWAFVGSQLRCSKARLTQLSYERNV